MLLIVFVIVVVIFLFCGVVVSILHLKFAQALVLMLPLMLMVCLLGNEVQDMRPVRIYEQGKWDICWPLVAELVAEVWWVAMAFWGLVTAILRMELVLALMAILALGLIYPILICTLKNIRASTGSGTTANVRSK